MKRILHVVSCFDTGGTEAFIMSQFRNIDTSIYKFDFLILMADSSPYQNEIEKLGGRVFYVHAKPNLLNIFSLKKILHKIICNYGPYDIVHSHINQANAIVLLTAKLLGIKNLISHSHNTNLCRGGLIRNMIFCLQQKIIRNSATILCACSNEAGIELYGNKTKFHIINNGIEFSRFANAIPQLDYRKEFNIPSCNKIYGNISRFDAQKNIPFVVDVFNEICKYQPNSTLIIGGQPGDKYKETISKIHNYKLEGKVVILNRRNDMPQLLKVMDAYIFPSTFEGLGIALLETQASGVPAFTSTNVPKFADVELGLLTYISLKEGPYKWAKTILSYKAPSTTVAQRLDKFRVSGYDIKTSVKKLEALYEQ